MAETEQAYLRRCYEEGICPLCGKSVEAGDPVGSGKIDEGRFCSLGCYAKYKQRELIEHHRQRLANSKDESRKNDESDR
jgi:hypothetical protein